MADLALENIKVLDLSRLLPGAYCTQILADFGAEVIKVEQPEFGDYERWYEPKVGGYSALFASVNRNKKSITLNLKNEKEREQLIELVKNADVLVESFRPGVMERLGLSYQTLKEVNPGLVYCAITGYGQTGPYKSFAGHDVNYLSYAGLLYYQREEHGKPSIPVTQIADISGGSLNAALGILIALMYKQRTGNGQFIDISMTDGVIAMLQTILPNFLAGENIIPGHINLGSARASYTVYETADRRYLAVSALEPKFWQEFCQCIGRTDFIKKLDAPAEVQTEMKMEIEEIIRQKTLAEWMVIFKEKDACVSPLITLEELIVNPQVKEREMIIEAKNQKHIGMPIKLSDTPGTIRTLAPKLGEHNIEILGKVRSKS